MMLFFERTCREVTTILVAREDRDLAGRDRRAQRIHLSICSTCPRFERQMLIRRHSFQLWRHYADENSAHSDTIAKRYLQKN